MNTGKKFENNFKASVPKEFYYLRLHDPAVGFTGGNSSYAVSNPFDCLMYTGQRLYWREDFETDGKKHTFEIKKHQIQGLQKAAAFPSIFAGLVINFRQAGETYYIPIDRFIAYTDVLDKKSLNAKDAAAMGGTPVGVRKLKVNERYDIRGLTEVMEHGG